MGIAERFTPDDPAGRTLPDAKAMLCDLEELADALAELAFRLRKPGPNITVEEYATLSLLYHLGGETREVCRAAADICEMWSDRHKGQASAKEVGS